MNHRIAAIIIGVALLAASIPAGALGQSATMTADIRDGSCAQPGSVTADLQDPAVASGPRQGAQNAVPAATSFTPVPAPLADLLASDHVVTLSAGDRIVACGAIGGPFAADGSLGIVLRPRASGGPDGIAYFATSGDVSLFVDLGALATAGTAVVPTATAAAAPTTAASPAPRAATPAAAATNSPAAPAPFQVAAMEHQDVPSGRDRQVWRIVVEPGLSTDEASATLGAAACQALASDPGSVVAIVFAYRPQDDPNAQYTVGVAELTRDGQGHAGDGQLILGNNSTPDQGDVGVAVVTRRYEPFPGVAVPTDEQVMHVACPT